MKKSNLIKEVFWIRSIACIAVTLGHALKAGHKQYPGPSNYTDITYVLYMAVLFGVPAFVFISEFLLANKYPINVPPNFIKKRLKILVIPYVFLNIVYTIIKVPKWSGKDILIELFKNIFLGESTIYFILIIFQFYFLHILINKYLKRLSPMKVMLFAFIVNLLYLAFFNFVKPYNNPYTHYIWDPGYWMPFVGWLFYFVLGYYCGKNYKAFLNLLRKYEKWVISMPVISMIILLVMNKYLLIAQNSKRVDMLFFSTCIIFLIIFLSSFVQKTPKIILLISNYLFSIFLLNQFFFIIFLRFKPPAFMNVLTYSMVIFILSILCSLAISLILNRFHFGKYLVGQIMNFKKENNKHNNTQTFIG